MPTHPRFAPPLPKPSLHPSSIFQLLAANRDGDDVDRPADTNTSNDINTMEVHTSRCPAGLLPLALEEEEEQCQRANVQPSPPAMDDTATIVPSSDSRRIREVKGYTSTTTNNSTSLFSSSLDIQLKEQPIFDTFSAPQKLERLYTLVADLQSKFGPDAVGIVPDVNIDDDDDDSTNNTLQINSLLFTVAYADGPAVSATTPTTVLVILRAIHRVNVTALAQCVHNWRCTTSTGNDCDTNTSASVSSFGIHRDQAIPPEQQTAITLSLTRSDRVQDLCGFAPGTVPPIGVWPEPFCTVVDQSLVEEQQQQDNNNGQFRSTPTTTAMVRGGGGLHNQSCVVSVRVLLQQNNVVVAPVAFPGTEAIPFGTAPTAGDRIPLVDESCSDNEAYNGNRSPSTDNMSVSSSPADKLERIAHPKPYFVVAPPQDDLAHYFLVLENDQDTMDADSSTRKNDSVRRLQPVSVTFVGRIAGVRRMARTLAFCDVIPPNRMELFRNGESSTETNNEGTDLWAWQSPLDDKAMAVQLIAGKRLCQNTGSDAAMRRLQTGQLLMIHGRTNVDSRNSLRNWITKRSLDIVLQSYQLLNEEPVNSYLEQNRFLDPAKDTTIHQRRVPPVSMASEVPENCLRLNDLYVDGISNSSKMDVAFPVAVVDDMQSVKAFSSDLSTLIQSLHGTHKNDCNDDRVDSSFSAVSLVGLDCEWQPTFLLQSPRAPQPVLLLQVSLHSLKRIYLFDFQTLLRPMMPPSQPMDKLEQEVESALGALFESKRLIKVGFQIVHDLRQCAASYPHMPSLHFYNSVLEASMLGKKAVRITGSGDARVASSSLSRLVEQFIGKPLNKQQQCSNWSHRPLTADQIEYAALDAAVTPILVERMIKDLGANVYWEKPQLGRWQNDLSFKKAIYSWRFVFVSTTDFEVQQKLKAKRVVGEPLVVSQCWTTGDIPPRLPALPENGSKGPYTDVWGFVQVPSNLVSIRSTRIDDIILLMLGERVGKSKDKCVEAFLRRPDVMPTGARLDYPQRSGFVEFRDGVALFVNMPNTPGGRFQPRSYPNEWLQEGRFLTWFLRENDWMQGTSVLAKKLTAHPSNGVITLFVRVGSTGAFLCCGRCQVQSPLGDSGSFGNVTRPHNWTLVKLVLDLLDWEKLRLNTDFQSLLNPDVCYAEEFSGDSWG